MSRLKKLGTIGTLGVIISGGLIFGSAQAGSAATCRTGLAAPTNTYPGTVAAATNFEANSLSPFIASTAGTGTAAVTSPLAHSGTCAATLHVTADAGSIANSALSLAAGTTTAYADGWFNITKAGVAGNDVPYYRFFSGSTRIADVYRYNSNGQLWLRVTAPNGTFVYTQLKASSIPLNSWHRVTMRVSARGTASTIQVWFDGSPEFTSSTVKMGATSLSSIMLGSEHARQMGDSYIDDVIIKRSAT
ncbi:hypothetical protein V3C33_16750 [Micrococcaceae bacterium Sec5.7]